MRVYVAGAHCSGKTTLCRYISEEYNLPLITETARTVLAQLEISIEKLRTDIMTVDSFQETIFHKQIDIEKSHKNGFVSDRAIDILAYTAEHSSNLQFIMASSYFKEYVEWLREGVIFFLRPHKSLLVEDGVRETPDWEGIIRIDGMVKFLLEQFGLKYLPIASLSMIERIRSVDFVLSKTKGD